MINLDKLKIAARTIKHCGDYGRLFVNGNKVFWIMGDSDGSNYYSKGKRVASNLKEDDPEFTHDSKRIEEILGKVPGVKEVETEAESGPYDEPEWKEIKYKQLGEAMDTKIKIILEGLEKQVMKEDLGDSSLVKARVEQLLKNIVNIYMKDLKVFDSFDTEKMNEAFYVKDFSNFITKLIHTDF